MSQGPPTILSHATTTVGDASFDGEHCLVVVKGRDIGSIVQLSGEPLVLGRDATRAFHLDDPEVSKTHCELWLRGDEVVVRDLGSTNGTRVDGERITGEARLSVLGLLRVGRHVLRHELRPTAEIDRSRELAGELERARHYVEALIPAPLRGGPLHADWSFVPSAVLGGDALGYHDLGDGRWALYVLDVCGHGTAPAMHSASVLNVLRNHTLPNTDFGAPCEVLAALNAVFPMEVHGNLFFTIWYGVLSTRDRSLVYSSAGHPPALVIDGTGRARELHRRNPPIGTMTGRAFGRSTTTLEPDERLYLFSDGVFETIGLDGESKGLAAFTRLASHSRRQPARGEPARLYDAVCETSVRLPLDDDFTLLVASLA